VRSENGSERELLGYRTRVLTLCERARDADLFDYPVPLVALAHDLGLRDDVGIVGFDEKRVPPALTASYSSCVIDRLEALLLVGALADPLPERQGRVEGFVHLPDPLVYLAALADGRQT
jgi:hypothetical protein